MKEIWTDEDGRKRSALNGELDWKPHKPKILKKNKITSNKNVFNSVFGDFFNK